MDTLNGMMSTYGQALAELAEERQELDAVTADLEIARKSIAQRDLALFLTNPTIPRKAKLELIDRIFGERTTQTFQTFLKVIMARRRERWFPGIIEAAFYACLKHQGFEIVTITTAIPMDEEERKAIGKTLARTIGGRIYQEYRVEPDLVGGIVVRHGSRLLDASIIGMLRRLAGVLEEDFSGGQG